MKDVPSVISSQGDHMNQLTINSISGLGIHVESFLTDQRSEHTKSAYRADIINYIKFVESTSSIPATFELISTEKIRDFKAFMLRSGYAHSTIDRHLAALSSLFSSLRCGGKIDHNPVEGVKFLNAKRLSPTIGLTDEQVRAMLEWPDRATAQGAFDYAVLMVLFYCGLRRGELCGLRIQDIAMERGQHVLRLIGKGNAERLVVVLPIVYEAIQSYFMRSGRPFQGDGFLFSPIRNNRTKTTDKAIHPTTVYGLIQRAARALRIDSRISPHSCRATAISNARDNGVPDRAIQEFAGWSSAEMITRYDKRKTAVENSAAHKITY